MILENVIFEKISGLYHCQAVNLFPDLVTCIM